MVNDGDSASDGAAFVATGAGIFLTLVFFGGVGFLFIRKLGPFAPKTPATTASMDVLEPTQELENPIAIDTAYAAHQHEEPAYAPPVLESKEAPMQAAGFCANCGVGWLPGARFCNECGTPIG